MKKLLPLLAALLMVGCTTTSTNPKAQGVIIEKEFDEGGVNYYYTGGGPDAGVPKPPAWWFKVRSDSGKDYTFTVDETTYYLMEPGDRWPQK